MDINMDTDLSTLDRGNNIEPAASTPAAPEATPAEKAVEEMVAKVEEAKAEPAQERDPETGKFTKKQKDDEGLSVPKARFDEQVAKERNARFAAEARASELQAKIDGAIHSVNTSQLEEQIVGLEKQYTKLMMDGDGDKAAEVLSTIRHKSAEFRNLEEQAAFAAQHSENQKMARINEERNMVDTVIADLERDYPEFNENSESFNQKLVNVVLAEQNRLIREEGMLPSQALATAAADVMTLRGDRVGLSSANTDVTTGKGDARKQEAVARNIAAAKAQPGSMRDIGIDSDRAGSNRPENEDAAKMTYEEFSALPESTKAKMRGDFI